MSTNKCNIKDLQVTYVNVEQLNPYERNSRTHSDAQVKEIASLIKEFGWTNPILMDGERGIIAGHGRLMAAKLLGMESVPCIELTGLSSAQKRALIIADNKVALKAGWDEDVLAHELDALRDQDYDLSMTGFDDAELADLIGSPSDPVSHQEQQATVDFGLLVSCVSAEQRSELMQRLIGEGYACGLKISE